MKNADKIPHPKLHLWLIVSLGTFSLFMAGCGDLLRIQSSSEPLSTVEIIQEAIEQLDETPIAISDIPDLPEHAPTATPEERPVETGIGDDPAETPISEPPEQPPSNVGLIDTAPHLPDADILILKPGDFSLLVSPFRISAHLEPGPNNYVDLKLLGEDGRVIMEKTVKVFPWEGAITATMVSMIEYELPPGSREAARLEISTIDEFGRPRAMNSIDLILMAEGEPMRNYTEQLKDEVVIQYPLENTVIQGKTLLLSGLVKSRSEKPLSVELIDEAGEVIGSSEAAVLLNGDDAYGLFATEVTYEISEPTWVRLVIRVPGARIPGTAYIKTRELLLYP